MHTVERSAGRLREPHRGERRGREKAEASWERVEKRGQVCRFIWAEVPSQPIFLTGAGDFCQIHPWQVLCNGCSQPKGFCGAAVLEEHCGGSRDDSGIWLPGQWVSGGAGEVRPSCDLTFLLLSEGREEAHEVNAVPELTQAGTRLDLSLPPSVSFSVSSLHRWLLMTVGWSPESPHVLS